MSGQGYPKTSTNTLWNYGVRTSNNVRLHKLCKVLYLQLLEMQLHRSALSPRTQAHKEPSWVVVTNRLKCDKVAVPIGDNQFQHSKPFVVSVPLLNSLMNRHLIRLLKMRVVPMLTLAALGRTFVIRYYTQWTADVYPYGASYQPMLNVPIASGATAWDDPVSGQTIILVVNEDLYYGKS